METRFFSFLLKGVFAVTFATSLAVQAQQNDEEQTPDVIQPNLDRRDINEANIDSENFEVGVYAGVIAIEDFESSPIVGARFAYHISEDFFVEATYAQADAGQTSFEVLSGGAPFLTDEDRDYTYYDLSLGYNLNGEVFFTKNLVFNQSFYFKAGAGSTDFGGDNRFTVSIGGGYRLLLTDYFALHADVRDHIFSSDLIGEDKDTHNIELVVGATFFF
jgi:outer membrane beta-barrel protein